MIRLLIALTFTCLFTPLLGAADHFSKAEPIHLTADGRRWVAHTLKSLSLEEKVGQMLNVRYFTDCQNFDATGYQSFLEKMRKYHMGSLVLTVHTDGPILLKNGPLEVA